LTLPNIVMYLGCDCRWVMDWILNLLTPLGTKGNYNAIANLNTLQITTAPTKPFPDSCVFSSRSLARASNTGHSSASRAQFLPSPTLIQNSLPVNPSTELDSHLFSTSLAELNCTQHSNDCLSYLLIWPGFLVI
jgi:hypothetical protein